MSPSDDYFDEMPSEEFMDDPTVAAFIAGVRNAGTRAPEPSPMLAHLLATGVSSHPQPKRSVPMRIKTYVAGLGVAAKVLLGAGVAVAATASAGAAGVLPKQVQHVVAATVEAVTPFNLSDRVDDHNSDHSATGTPGGLGSGGVDHSAVGEPTTPSDGHDRVAPTTTTEVHSAPAPAAGSNEPIHHDTTTTQVTPTTEVHHETPTSTTVTTTPVSGGDNNNPQSLSLTCTSGREPSRIACSWTASSNPDHRRYALLRTNSQNTEGRVVFQTETQLTYTDSAVTPGVTFTYRVVSLRADGSTESHSNAVGTLCC